MPALDSGTEARPRSAAASAHVPMRTCIASREKIPRSQLLRCVAQHSDDGTVRIVADPRGQLPGRGAWLTPSESALDTAIDRKAFQRALRLGKAAIDAEALRGTVMQMSSKE